MTRPIAATILVAGLLALAMLGVLPFVMEASGRLAFGWLTYMGRVLPNVRIAWEGVATGLVCLAFFTLGLHPTLKWLHGEVQKGRGLAVQARRAWRFRWTAALAALIVVMFLVGIAATGIVHQAGWLVASRRSLLEVKVSFEDRWGDSAQHLRHLGLSSPILTLAALEPPGEPSGSAMPAQSWMTRILPGTDFTLGGRLREDMPWNDPANSAYFKGVVPFYLNPAVRAIRSPEGYALAHYAGNVHVLAPGRSFRWAEAAGSGNTIIAGEVAEGFKPWGDPTNLRDPGAGLRNRPDAFGSPTEKGAYFLFLDGSVRFFRETASSTVLERLSRPEKRGG